MNFNTSLKSYALLYAVFVFVIISLISSSLILLSYFNNIYINTIIQNENLRMNVSSGINLLLSDPDLVKSNEKRELALYGQEEDMIELERRDWGIYELLSSSASWKNYKKKKIALAGDYCLDDQSVALFLSDMDKPLSLCGKTIIKGKCFLPKSGLRRAYIEGENFVGEQMVDGSISNSSSHLPELNNRLQNISLTYFQEKFMTKKNKIIFYEEIKKDTFLNSFFEPTIIIYSPNKIHLAHKYLKGNIIIISENEVEITRDNLLEEIVVFAPYIKTEQSVEAKLQLIASDSILIDKNCNLRFPSVIALLNNEQKNISPSVILNNHTEVNGIVICFKKIMNGTNQPSIKISENTIIKGQVYCNGVVEHKGIIFGSLYTEKFVLKTSSSFYENHLLDAVIDLSELTKFYVGIDILRKEKGKGKIIKWVN